MAIDLTSFGRRQLIFASAALLSALLPGRAARGLPSAAAAEDSGPTAGRTGLAAARRAWRRARHRPRPSALGARRGHRPHPARASGPGPLLAGRQSRATQRVSPAVPPLHVADVHPAPAPVCRHGHEPSGRALPDHREPPGRRARHSGAVARGPAHQPAAARRLAPARARRASR